MLDFISVPLYRCKCRNCGIAQNGWQGKALTDLSLLDLYPYECSYMKQDLTTGMIAISVRSKVLTAVFSDADTRC